MNMTLRDEWIVFGGWPPAVPPELIESHRILLLSRVVGEHYILYNSEWSAFCHVHGAGHSATN